MKKIYILALGLVSFAGFAQNTVTIGFEGTEGYTLGNLHGQNGWEITDNYGTIVDNQEVSNEQSKDSEQSFKNGFLPQFEDMPFPMIGGAYQFSQPLSSTNSSISFDFYVTESMGSDFEIVFYHKDEIDEYYPVAGVGIAFDNTFYFTINEYYQATYVEDKPWQPNTWVNVRLEVADDTVIGYINNEVAIEFPRFSTNSIHGFNILHNNWGADAYFDNIVVSYESLNNNQFELSQAAVFPNPATETITVTGVNLEVESIEVYNLLGQKVLTANQLSTLNVSELSQGTYVAKVKHTNGQSFQRKFVKK
jgi:hypothetical protein